MGPFRSCNVPCSSESCFLVQLRYFLFKAFCFFSRVAPGVVEVQSLCERPFHSVWLVETSPVWHAIDRLALSIQFEVTLCDGWSRMFKSATTLPSCATLKLSP